jgi:hypothetical protein
MWAAWTFMLSSFRLLRAPVLLAILAGVLWVAPAAFAQASPPLPAPAPAAHPATNVAEETELLLPRRAPASPERRAGALSDSVDEADQDADESPSVWARGAEVLGMAILILPFIAVLFGIPTSVAAVTVAMDDGVLRFGLSFVGWVLALVGGFFAGSLCMGLAGTILDTKSLGPGALWLIFGGIVAFLVGHGAARVRIRRWLRSLPREKAVAWRRTLTGGALVGAGVGSVAKLLRSLFTLKGSGFGGFGGGSFGGGGASGSWSGASGAASASSAGAGAGAGSGAAGAAPAASAAAQGTEAAASERGRWLTQWRRRLHWYHAAAFGLVTLVFYGVASVTMELFPFWGAVVPAAVVVAGGLWRWGASLKGERYRSEAASESRAETTLSSSRDRWTDR